MIPDEKKERKKDEKKNIGFYAAVYSCAAVMLALAALVGYQSFYGGKTAQVETTPEPGIQSVDARSDKRISEYLAPEDMPAEQVGNVGSAVSGGDFAAKPTPAPTAVATPSPTVKPNDSTSTFVIPDGEQVGGQENFVNDDTFAASSPVSQSIPDGDEANKPAETVEASVEETSESAFTAFNDGDSLDWPLVGEIVFDYNKEHTVFDPTLEQRRTNETLCIAGEYGDEVRAAADGKVESFNWSHEMGNTLTIEHGNGWRTTYSRLREDIPVSVGDVVSKGQVIGSVANPPIFSVTLGTHLGFSVTHSGEYLNPKDLLTSN